MPGVQGMEGSKRFWNSDPGIDVLINDGYYSTESAVERFKNAADYFPKPSHPISSGKNRPDKGDSKHRAAQLEAGKRTSREF